MSQQLRKSYLVNRSTGKRLRINGCLPSQDAPPQSKQYAATRFQCEQLPAWVDLRPFLSPVEDQGQVGSCTANALAGAYEYLVRRLSGDQNDVSRLFLYYNARRYDNIQGDRGSSITTSIRVLQELGICREYVWSYEPARVNSQPSAAAYQDARNFQVREAEQLNIDCYTMKHCLAEGYPFAFGMRLFDSFNQATRSGMVPMPNADEAQRAEHGMHAMLCVGYSDQAQVFIVRNSWGTNWGDQGYCYIPYNYLANPEFTFDAWTIYTLSDVDLTPGITVQGKEPVLGSSQLDEDLDYEFEELDELTEETEKNETEKVPVML